MLSIIVPAYLMTQETADLWAANRAQLEQVASVPYELIVIDNGSKYALPMDHTCTAFPTNRGIAPAWNLGWQKSKGDLLCFLTITTRVEPGWDAKLCAVAKPGRYIAMPYTNGAKPYNGLGITGWCWVIRRDLADEVGPFDETFVPVQYEDTDFFHRAIYSHGIELVNVPGALVTKSGTSLTLKTAPWGDPHRRNWIHLANRYRYAWKHNVDPADVPPFWKSPLRDVEVPEAVGVA